MGLGSDIQEKTGEIPETPDVGHPCDFISRNLRLGGRRTSIRLERAMWQALEDIALRECRTLRELCALVDARRRGNNLTAAVRLFIISYFRLAIGALDGVTLEAPRALSARGMAESRFSNLMVQALSALE